MSPLLSSFVGTSCVVVLPGVTVPVRSSDGTGGNSGISSPKLSVGVTVSQSKLGGIAGAGVPGTGSG